MKSQVNINDVVESGQMGEGKGCDNFNNGERNFFRGRG